MERAERTGLLTEFGRGVIYGLIFRKPTSGLTATFEGGYARVGVANSTTPAEKRVAAGTIVITASKDAYLYLDSTGTVAKTEVALGAAKPSQADIGVNSEFLAKLVTDATDITSVTDLRNTQAGHGRITTLEVPVSFETGEQADNPTRIGYNARVLAILASVTKALAGVDVGTVTASIGENDVYTAVTNGVISLALSSALNARAEAIPSALHHIRAGNSLKLISAKTTAGGKALVTVVLETQR